MREHLKTLRRESGFTVDDMAAKLGISPWHYYKIEQGSRNPSIHLAKQIADTFGKSVDELFFAQELDDESTVAEDSAHG